jgi:hypothetical protein
MNAALPPVPAGFSKKAVRRAVLSRVAGAPLSIYPIVLGVLGISGALLFDSTIALLAGAAGLLWGLGRYAVNYFFRYDSIASEHVRGLMAARRRYLEERPKRVREGLVDASFTDGVEQMDKVTGKFEQLGQVLAERFEAGELTHARYSAMAEQVYLSALDNLQHAASLLRSVATIDADYLEDRLRDLDGKQSAEAEAAPLKERLALKHDVMEDVKVRLLDNERAMTVLDTTAVRLAAVQTKKGQADLDLETAMVELEKLAERSAVYATRR